MEAMVLVLAVVSYFAIAFSEWAMRDENFRKGIKVSVVVLLLIGLPCLFGEISLTEYKSSEQIIKLEKVNENDFYVNTFDGYTIIKHDGIEERIKFDSINKSNDNFILIRKYTWDENSFPNNLIINSGKPKEIELYLVDYVESINEL